MIRLGGFDMILTNNHVISIKRNVVDSIAYKKALARMKTLSGKGGVPVPEDENGLSALIDAKYKL